jgi:acetyl esterase/lipase
MDLPLAAPANFSDHVFKIVHGVELALRIWPADPPPPAGIRSPFIFFTHGGGYTAGRHFTPLAWMHSGLISRGFHLVSSSYRLAPQVRVDEQLDDCLDAMAWCNANLPRVIGANKIDMERFVVCGDSAGGTLATLLGHRLNPSPRAVIDIYGVVDFMSSGIVELPNAAAASNPPEWKGEFTDAELEAFLDDRDPVKALTYAPPWIAKWTDEVMSKAWAMEFHNTTRMRMQSEFHVWLAYRGMSGGDIRRSIFHQEKFADEDALVAYAKSLSSHVLLQGKTWYPPTAFLHATGDPAVPISQSINMAKRLRDMGVPVIESYEPATEHVFDNKYIVSGTHTLILIYGSSPA